MNCILNNIFRKYMNITFDAKSLIDLMYIVWNLYYEGNFNDLNDTSRIIQNLFAINNFDKSYPYDINLLSYFIGYSELMLGNIDESEEIFEELISRSNITDDIKEWSSNNLRNIKYDKEQKK